MMRAQGVELPPRPIDPGREEEMARREARITTTVELGAYAEKKRAALMAHASQLHNIRWLQVPNTEVAPIFARESFIRERDETGAPTPEADLFAGLR